MPRADGRTVLSTNYTVPAGGATVGLYCQIYQPTGLVTARFDDAFLTGASGTGVRYYHGDHLGSARLMTNSFGSVTFSATYLPFGQEWNPQATTNHYKFTGKERDAESGNDNFEARYYGSTLGRFLSADPGNIGADVGDPQSWNAYSYVGNNPLNYTDPTGLYTECASSGEFPPCADVDDAFPSGETQGQMVGQAAGTGQAQAPPPPPVPGAKCVGVFCKILCWIFCGGGASTGEPPASPNPRLLLEHRPNSAKDLNDNDILAGVKLTGIEADPDGYANQILSRGCSVEGVKAVMRDAVHADAIDAVVNSVAARSSAPLKALVTGDAAVSATERGADYIGQHRAAQKVIKAASGGVLSANKAGRWAGRVGKSLAFLGYLSMANDAREGYNACMGN